MIQRRFFAAFLLLLPLPLRAQEAHSFAIGGAATAEPMGLFGFYWNPSQLAIPSSGKDIWEVGTGGSFFDTSNINSPVLRFTSANALQSAQEPVQRFQQYLGTAAVKVSSAAGAVVFDQDLQYRASQGALAFFADREAGTIGTGAGYSLDYQETQRQIADIVLSYGMPFPLGTLPFFSIGGSLKYHDGLQYQQTTLSGVYHQGSGTGYTYTRTTSTSGLGLSIDGGFLARFNETLSLGMMFQNLQSTFNWQAVQRTYNLDPNTGAETQVGSVDVNLPENFPYATKLGVTAAPPDKNMAIEGEVSWTQGQVHWKGGLEHWYPESHLTIRLGTFNDQVSNSQLWTFGAGYQLPNFTINAAIVTRSLPAIQDSIAFGAALDAEVRF